MIYIYDVKLAQHCDIFHILTQTKATSQLHVFIFIL